MQSPAGTNVARSAQVDEHTQFSLKSVAGVTMFEYESMIAAGFHPVLKSDLLEIRS
jgi:hypothetical protein